MVVHRIQPRNLPGIKKHFDQQKKCIKEKLRALAKKKIELEAELSIAEDGIEMCENMYAQSKAAQQKQVKENLAQFSKMIGD